MFAWGKDAFRRNCFDKFIDSINICTKIAFLDIHQVRKDIAWGGDKQTWMHYQFFPHHHIKSIICLDSPMHIATNSVNRLTPYVDIILLFLVSTYQVHLLALFVTYNALLEHCVLMNCIVWSGKILLVVDDGRYAVHFWGYKKLSSATRAIICILDTINTSIQKDSWKKIAFAMWQRALDFTFYIFSIFIIWVLSIKFRPKTLQSCDRYVFSLDGFFYLSR